MRLENKLLKQWLIGACSALGLTVVMLGLDFPAPVQAQTSPAQFRLLQSDADHVVLELEVSGYTRQARSVGRANYVVLSIPDLGFTGEAGKPQMPVKGTMIGIPNGAQPSLKIVVDDVQRVMLDAPPLPVPTPLIQRDPKRAVPREAGETFSPNAATYGANRPYPTDAARIGTDSKLRSQRYLTIQFYPLQYNGATHELTFHRRLRVEITFSYPAGRTSQAVGGTVNEGTFEPMLQKSLFNYDSAKAWRARTVPARASAKATQTSEPLFRIGVNADGMYKVTCAQLQAKGADAGLDPNTLRVYKDYYQTNELRIYQSWQSGDSCDDNHYIAFWGLGLTTKYTDTNVYWLTYGSSTAGKRMTTRDGSGSGLTPATPDPYTQTTHLEDNLYYFSDVPGPIEGLERWYWTYVSAGSSWTTNFTVADLATTTPNSATLALSLAGYTDGAHQIQVSVNGYTTPLTEIVQSGQGPFTGTVLFPMAYLANGTNSISVVESASDSIAVVNSFDVGYTRAYVALTDTLRFRQPTSGAWQYTITNFSNSTLQAFDITDPLNVVRIVTPTITQPDTTYTYQFADNQTTAREYVALATAQFKTPTSITLDSSSDLKNSTGAQYLIITYDDFYTSALTLATFRGQTTTGLVTKTVKVQDVYDEFNDGVIDPQAIRDFLKYTYDYWSPRPEMVLLVGDGHFDPRGYCVTAGKCPQGDTTPNTIFIPPALRIADTSKHIETADDNYFVAFNDSSGDLMPQMALGRLPVNSTSELNTIIDKLMKYEQSTPSGAWRSRVTFASADSYMDDGTRDDYFWEYSDKIASNSYYFPAWFTADRIYFNPCDPTVYSQCKLSYPAYTIGDDVRNGIISTINITGSLIVNYVGHGSSGTYGGRMSGNYFEELFATADIGSLANGYKLPVMIEMTCDTGYYIMPSVASLAETNVRKAGGGALASWSATGWGQASGHDFLDRGFFEAVMWNNVRMIGPATVAGKALLWANDKTQTDLMKMFVLLGDPASHLEAQYVNNHSYLPMIQRH